MSRAKDGRYRDSRAALPCRCGHPLGVHLAEGDRECLNRELGDGTDCSCAGYQRPAATPPAR